MARLILTPLDLNKNELQNPRIHVLASAPGSPVTGQLYYDSTTNKLYYWNGSGWISAAGGAVATDAIFDAKGDLPVGTGADTAQKLTVGADGTFLKAASGQTTGLQWASIAASDVSGFDTQVRTSRLDQMAAPTAAVGLNSQKITALADPTTGTDAANKQYVDAAVAGLSWKEPVRAATTAAGTLASSFENGDAIDGVTLATGDRILIKDQAAPAENGIYTVNASGAPTRATDADSQADLQGAAVFVDSGTVNGDTLWTMTAAGAITLGTTALPWVQFGGVGEYTAGTGLTKTGNQFSVTVPLRKYSALIGNASSTSFTITQATHGAASDGTNLVQVMDATTGAVVLPDIAVNNSNGTVTLTFTSAPASNAYRVVILG